MDSTVVRKKNYTPYILVIVLFSLLAFVYTFKVLPKQYAEKKQGDHLLDFKPSEITRLEIKYNNQTTIIDKQDNLWYVAGQPADERLAVNIEELTRLGSSRVISSQPEKHGFFEVDEEKGVVIKLLKDEDLKAGLIVGKPGPNYSSSYVRLDGEKDVYLVDAGLTFYWQRSDWVQVKVEDTQLQ